MFVVPLCLFFCLRSYFVIFKIVFLAFELCVSCVVLISLNGILAVFNFGLSCIRYICDRAFVPFYFFLILFLLIDCCINMLSA